VDAVSSSRQPPAGAYKVLYLFTGAADGDTPGNLINSGGVLYGTTIGGGGANDAGTIYKMTTAGTLTTLYTFTGDSDGGHPTGRLIRDGNGNIHGVAQSGGDSKCKCGVVYRLSSTGTESVLHSFKNRRTESFRLAVSWIWAARFTDRQPKAEAAVFNRTVVAFFSKLGTPAPSPFFTLSRAQPTARSR
jgi:uncharacterized repeat protein (TIGR03803 family)